MNGNLSFCENKIEYIGKVKLDYSVYPGEDFYCDGEVENELLDIVKNNAPEKFDEIIEKRADWPTFYHLSSERENIVRWLPIDKNSKVLEVGSGCGAITGAFAELAKEVVSCDLSRKRSLINAYRHKDADNITIHVGNFTDVEKNLPNDFDYICLIGVLEYGALYIDSATPYKDFLLTLKKHLKKDGRIVIAIENRLGLKYFAGCREDHLGTFFSGIEGYSDKNNVRTFSKNALTEVIEEAGFKDYRFYYPYPDYKFMTTLYSDRRLPKIAELNNNKRYFDNSRMSLFDEKAAFDALSEDGLFDIFSNSFLVVLGPETELDYYDFNCPDHEDLLLKIGNRNINAEESLHKYGELGSVNRIQIYPSDEKGNFSEATSYFAPGVCPFKEKTNITVSSEERSMLLRIDPCNVPCIVTIYELWIDNVKMENIKRYLVTNGKNVGSAFVFNSSDPNVIVNLKKFSGKGKHEVSLAIKVEPIDADTANNLCK